MQNAQLSGQPNASSPVRTRPTPMLKRTAIHPTELSSRSHLRNSSRGFVPTSPHAFSSDFSSGTLHPNSLPELSFRLSFDSSFRSLACPDTCPSACTLVRPSDFHSARPLACDLTRDQTFRMGMSEELELQVTGLL